MEKMPFQPDLDRAGTSTKPGTVTSTAWRSGLPVLGSTTFTLRELRMDDAPSLLTMLATEEVARFISPPPSSVEAFEKFIAWSHRERAAGNCICFGVVPVGLDHAIGLFQLRSLEPGFASAEWGFALGSEYWGTGLFVEGALKVVDFAIDVVGARRLEARAVVGNARGNGALRKIGAIQEGVLRRSFLRHGKHHDQFLWSILAEDWRSQRAAPTAGVVH